MNENFKSGSFPQHSKSDPQNAEVRKFNRRQILQISFLGGTGLMLAPFLIDEAKAQVRGEVHQYVYWFAQQIGLRKLDNNVDVYINFLRNRGDIGWANEMQLAKNRMTRGGIFTDPSVSAVYAHDLTAFFPMRSRVSGFNACAPFLVNGEFTGVMSEGPTLIGLAFAAQFLRATGNDAEEARDLLFATDGIQPSIGSFDKGYTQVEHFRTKAGKVRIDYNVTNYDPNTNSGKGEILVKAERDLRTGGREVVFDKQWDISFNV